MKHVMSILKSCVGFLLLAVLIGVTVSYFNRGKDAAVKSMDNVLGVVEGASMEALSLTSYDGKVIKGSEVISIIESLRDSGSAVPVLVFTDGGGTVAEYTGNGATPGESIKVTSNSNTTIYLGKVIAGVTVAVRQTGDYRSEMSATYINPAVEYAVDCYYSSNKALLFVAVVQQ